MELHKEFFLVILGFDFIIHGLEFSYCSTNSSILKIVKPFSVSSNFNGVDASLKLTSLRASCRYSADQLWVKVMLM